MIQVLFLYVLLFRGIDASGFGHGFWQKHVNLFSCICAGKTLCSLNLHRYILAYNTISNFPEQIKWLLNQLTSEGHLFWCAYLETSTFQHV